MTFKNHDIGEMFKDLKDGRIYLLYHVNPAMNEALVWLDGDFEGTVDLDESDIVQLERLS